MRFEIIDVRGVTVDFFMNRVSGAMQEILPIACIRDGLTRLFIDLPTVKNFIGGIALLRSLDRCVAAVTYDIEDFLML